VQNSGLGSGDLISLHGNDLDRSQESEDLENRRQLEARGVIVQY
jgi:hypothetical protein